MANFLNWSSTNKIFINISTIDYEIEIEKINIRNYFISVNLTNLSQVAKLNRVHIL